MAGEQNQRIKAEILEKKAAAIRQLVDAGYEHESVVKAIDTGDITQLKAR